MKITMKSLALIWASALVSLCVPPNTFSGVCGGNLNFTCCETSGDCGGQCSVTNWQSCATDDDCTKLCSISGNECTSNEDCTEEGEICDLCPPQDCHEVLSMCSYSLLFCSTDDDCTKLCSISGNPCTSNDDCTAGGDFCDLCSGPGVGLCSENMMGGDFNLCMRDDSCADYCLEIGNCVGGPDEGNLCIITSAVGLCSAVVPPQFCSTDEECAGSYCSWIGQPCTVDEDCPYYGEGETCDQRSASCLEWGNQLGFCSDYSSYCNTDEDCDTSYCIFNGYCSDQYEHCSMTHVPCAGPEDCGNVCDTTGGPCTVDTDCPGYDYGDRCRAQTCLGPSCVTPLKMCDDGTTTYPDCNSDDDCMYGGTCRPVFRCVNDTTGACAATPYCFDTEFSTDCDPGYSCSGDLFCCADTCEPDPAYTLRNLLGVPFFCTDGTCESCFEDVCIEPGECNDSNACTADDCVAYQCQNTPVDCDDQNQCTDDSCDDETGCVNSCNAAGNQDPCCDDLTCSGEAICQGGYPQAANTVAASHGRTSLIGSGILNSLALVVIPVGVVMLLRILRRKR